MNNAQQQPHEGSADGFKPGNSTTNGPVIDVNAFPHILDAIFDFCPRSSLIALRATCKSYRDKVDVRLNRHILFSLYAPGNIQAIDGRAPALYSFNDAYGDALTKALQHTRVADVVGPVGFTALRGHQIAHELNLGTLRLRRHTGGRPPSAVPFIAPTVITFTTFIEDGFQNEPPVAETGHIREGTEHFILNIRYDPGRSYMPQAYIQPFARPLSLKSVTIIFTEQTTHREEEVWSRRATRRMGMLNSIISSLAMGIPKGVEYTLVDVHTLRLAWLGISADGRKASRNDPYAARDAIMSAVVAQCKNWERCSEEEAIAIAAKIKFLTRAEYRALVGEEQFVLATRE